MSVKEEKNGGAKNTEGTSGSEMEAPQKKLKYPRAIPFIIGNEFCERFNFYGMRTILVLYLTRVLFYDSDTATVIYHAFIMLVYFMCIFGAIIADSWLGKFKTILSLSIVYVCGSVVISLGAIPQINLPGREMTLLGLLLIAIGSGGIKPCVAAFGGDQFKMPEQAKAMATFFSLFYFAINSGSLISTTVTPILREDVQCFGDDSCYSLAFGVPAMLMATSIVIFILGRWLYKNSPPSGNMFVLVSKAIGNAISTRSKNGRIAGKEHWLDYAEEKYGAQLVADIKVLLRVLVLYIPLPIFWALFDQQGSRWTFQATRMDGDIGLFTIKPDQMQLLNPLLILVFIPMYDFLVYPLLAKIGIRRHLQKLCIGGILAGVSFIISGIVEIELEKTYPVLPSADSTQLRLFNGIPGCPYDIQTNIPNLEKFELKELGMFAEQYVDVSKQIQFDFSMKSSKAECPEYTGTLDVTREKAFSYFFTSTQSGIVFERYEDDPEKPDRGYPYVRVLPSLLSERKISLRKGDDKRYEKVSTYRGKEEVSFATYDLYVEDNLVKSSLDFKTGGVYTLLLIETAAQQFQVSLIEVTEPNSMNMLWLMPQYIIITLGEVMFSVTGLEFSYEQAPISMKSVIQACWLLTVAFGNLIVIIIAESKIFESQASEFFLFAGLMLVDMLAFSYLAYRYKPNTNKTVEDKNTQKYDEGKAESDGKEIGILNPSFENERL